MAHLLTTTPQKGTLITNKGSDWDYVPLVGYFYLNDRGWVYELGHSGRWEICPFSEVVSFIPDEDKP